VRVFMHVVYYNILYCGFVYRKNDVATVPSSRSGIRLSEIYLHYNNICCTDTLSPPPHRPRYISKLRSVSLAMPIQWRRLQRLSLSPPSPNVRPTPLVNPSPPPYCHPQGAALSIRQTIVVVIFKCDRSTAAIWKVVNG